MSQKHQIHLNKPQLRSALIMAPEEFAVLARGTGKTKGIIAPKSAQYLDMMPRCVGVFVGATFQQILTRTLPPVVAGWERMGYKNGIHYLIGQKPPARWKQMWNWDGPYHLPFNYEYFISWWNGAGIQLISQDRAGSSNGVSIDFIMGDEAKLLNEKRLKEELFPANRGLYRDLIDNPHHHGKTFTTDMPVGTAGRWILNKREEMDPVRLQGIISLLIRKNEINQHLSQTKNQQTIQKYGRALMEIDKGLNLLRKNFIYYHEASALDNLDALGIDYIKEELRSLSRFEFLTSILNKRPYKLEDGFYPMLDEEKHGYFAYDYHHFAQAGYDFELLSKFDDCRKDGDLVKGSALHIAMDFNRRIWPLVVAQPHQINSEESELRVVKCFHALFPHGLSHVLDQFNDYYKYHKRKVIYFWYDHTALGETRDTIRHDIVTGLRDRGWIVIERYIGKAADHILKYKNIYNILAENGTFPWYVRINRDNCKYLLLSMYQAQAIESDKGFKKNKQTERDPKFPAEESTHFSDAVDTLFYGIIQSGLPFDEQADEPIRESIEFR